MAKRFIKNNVGKLRRTDLKFDHNDKIIIEWIDADGILRSTRRKVTSDVRMSIYVCSRRRYLSEMEHLPDYTSIPIFDEDFENLETVSRFRIRPEDVDPTHVPEGAFVRRPLGKHNPKYFQENISTDENGKIFVEYPKANGEIVRELRALRGTKKTCVMLHNRMVLLEDMEQLPDDSGVNVFKYK